jgi:plasmid stabilization system protein ParE
MRRRVEFAAWWDADLNLRAARYAEQGGDELAERFVNAVEATVKILVGNPHLGRRTYPNDPDVTEFHSCWSKLLSKGIWSSIVSRTKC